MDLEVMKSYLVKVGFTVDSNDFNKFQGSIKSVEELITKHTGSMTKKFVEAGGAIVSAYAAVGTAAITLMDKVATADMGYQLYAMRMYMSVDAAKKLKIATDALGYSLDEIAWNPELRERLKELYRIQGVMEKGLGPGFKDSMKGIRDFQAEWQKLKVEAGYISQSLASSIFKAFGGDGDLLTKLKSWTEWIANHIPEITKKISQYLIPILKDAWEIFKNIGKAVRDVVFVLGELTGDLLGGNKMDKATNQYEKLAIAMKNISGFVKEATSHLKHFTQVFMVLAGIMVGKAAGAAIMALGAAMANPAVVAAGAAIFIAGGVVGGGVGLHYAKTLDQIENENEFLPFTDEGSRDLDMYRSKSKKSANQPSLPPSQERGRGWEKLWNSVFPKNSIPSAEQLGQPSASGFPSKLEWSPLMKKLFGKDAETMTKVMQAESGGRNIIGKQNKNGSYDYGLFQINARVWLKQLRDAGIVDTAKDLLDPIKNIAAAKFVYQKQGLGAWKASSSRWAKDGQRSQNNSSVKHGDTYTFHINGGKDSAETIAKRVKREFDEAKNRRVARLISQSGSTWSDQRA